MSPLSHKRRLLHLATGASVATAGILIAAKLAAWLLTGSVSVLASLVDSLMDAAASVVNLIAVRYSLEPPDAEHRFGHGKAESLAGLAQATFIGGSAVFLVLHAVDRLLHPRPLQDVPVGVSVMVFAIAATLVLLAIQRYVIRRTGSTAIRADSLHYRSDLLVNASIILALMLETRGWTGFDPVFALAIAAYILYSAWHIGHDAFQLLMDRELPPEMQERVRRVALDDARVLGIHDLRTRQSGQTPFVQLHIELHPDMSLTEAHAIADHIEFAIRETLPGADVIIHQDPTTPHEASGRA
ncbi:MAG: cation diffusion facilitator family transporter [Gammaproteobacteria bacterium]|jgi:ferrous-iron efflux pump FieF